MTVVDPTKRWTHPVPVWASRPDDDGLIASYTLPLWAFLLLGVLLTVNVLGWSIVGIVELVQYVINAL